MSFKQIDDKRDIYVGPDGRLLRNMKSKVKPELDDDNEPYLMCRSRKDPQKQERRYLKVLVFEHHAGIPNVHAAKLGKDDVQIIDEDNGIYITNLQMTESGMEKVENMNGFKAEEEKADARRETGDESSETGDEVESDKETKSQSSKETEPQSDDEEVEGQTADVKRETADDDDEPGDGRGQTADPKPVLKAVPTTKGGSHYNLLDDAGNNVLDTYNAGKKVNGQKNLDAIAEDHDVVIEIEDE